MNRKENEQLKKIDQLDQQLDNTINKIGATKIKPIKISKKKLALFILIPFSIACLISAVTSFLLIDPFHWYTKPRSDLELKQEKEIKLINQQFNDLNLASSLDSSNTVADLLWEVNHHPNISNIIQKPNEIKGVTSKKSNDSKLSGNSEEVNIKIIVRTGSLEKEIDVKLLFIIENYKVKQINKLVKSEIFTNKIKTEIEADGVKRVSNLVDVTKTIINANNEFKAVFKDVVFDITNDKNDDEIIASGLKTLNVNFSFTENNKSINSWIKLNLNLQGKTRKEINQYLAKKLEKFKLSFDDYTVTGKFVARSAFAEKSTYKDLIDEFTSAALKNNFYFSTNNFKEFDNNSSKISVDFTIEGKTNDQQLEQTMSIENGKEWKVVTLKFWASVGNGQDKHIAIVNNYFTVIIMREDYPHKELFLYISKVREAIFQDIFKYEVKAKIGEKYGKLRLELVKEVDRLIKEIKKPNDKYDAKVILTSAFYDQGGFKDIFAGSYTMRLIFHFNSSEIPDSPELSLLYISIPIK